ncbi:DNA-methyltransferase (plasmid) [Weissella paramesenteroides]
MLINSVADVRLLIEKEYNELLCQKEMTLGLPEYNDRTKEWRVALLYRNNSVGLLFYSGFTGEKNSARSSSLDIIEKKINRLKKNGVKKTKKDDTFYVSDLKNSLVLGDSIEELKKLPDNSIDMVFTSPPYYNAKTEYSEYVSYDDYLNFIDDIIKEVNRVLIPGKFFIMNSSPILIPRIDRLHSSTRLAVPYDIHSLFRKNEYEFVDDIYWVKPSGAGWSAGRGRRFSADRNPMQYKPVPVTENIMVYRKKSDKLIDWFIRKNPNQDIIKDSKVKDGYETTNIWKINPAKDKRHPAIFPIELAEKVISYYSFKNDVILDPFGGLGTTAKAALKLDRRFFSIELDEKYFEESVRDIDRDFSLLFSDIDVKR